MIGIICALSIEADGIKNMMTDRQESTYGKIVYTSGVINGNKAVVAECGIGKVNAAMCAQIMIDRFSPSAIINSGIAGALSKELTVGDIVIAKDVVQHDMDATELGDPLGQIQFNDEKRIDIPCDEELSEKLRNACAVLENTRALQGRIATGDVFVSAKEKRLAVGSTFNADACEMEGGAVGQVCYRNEVPFAILRSISDSIDENTAMDFMQFRELAADNSIRVIAEFFDSL